jgi:CRISPR-associated exonuclease Cas4
MCTHSSFFVDMDAYRSIALVKKPSATHGTEFVQAKASLFEGTDKGERKRRFNMCHWFNPDRSELFFARKAVLVEGATEKSILPMLARRVGRWKSDVTIIDCGGKASIALYIEVLNAFDIKYVVVHDEDPITVEQGHEDYQGQKEIFSKNAEIAAGLDGSLGSIDVLAPDFEAVAGISKSQVIGKGKPIAALDRFKDEGAEIPERLKQVIDTMYA